MKKSILVGALLVSTLSFGQKKNVTSAAVGFLNNYVPSMKAQEYDKAKSELLNAKGFIDLAIVHEDTKEDPKALYYFGQIYLAAPNLAAKSKDSAFLEQFGGNEAAINKSVEAYQKSYEMSKKYRSEIEDAALNGQRDFNTLANEAYEAEDFTSAAKYYGIRAKVMTAMNVLDTNAVYYTGISARQAGDFDLAASSFLKCAEAGYNGANSYYLAANAFRSAGNTDKATAVVEEARKTYPNDKDLLLELVNINLELQNAAGAEAALADAIKADPNNKALYYTIGTIYTELKENEKAEEALNKALEIDPDFMDAQYQLGAHLVSWAGELKTQANNLKLGDAQYDVLLSQSDEVFKRALAPLESYISKNPNDGPVLKILSQLHRSLGNSEKSAEYRKRSEEAK